MPSLDDIHVDSSPARPSSPPLEYSTPSSPSPPSLTLPTESIASPATAALSLLLGTPAQPTPVSAHPAKRRQGQLQYVDREAVTKKLKIETKNELTKWILACSTTSAPDNERDVITFATILSIRDTLRELTAPPVGRPVWVVPKDLKNEINKYVIRVLLSPSITEYDSGVPLTKIMKIIESKRWGLSATVRHDDDGKWDALLECTRLLITQRKSDIKKMLDSSFESQEATHGPSDHSDSVTNKKGKHAKDIIELCQSLTRIGIKSVHTGLVVTVPMCARIAFLRAVLCENPKNTSYWQIVDKKLDAIRTKYNGHEYKQSKHLMFILEEDKKLYPGANMKMLDDVTPLSTQQEVDMFLDKDDPHSLGGSQPADGMTE